MPTMPPLPLPPLPALPVPIVSWIANAIIVVIMLAMIIRAIASWFRADERYAFIRFLAYITDPFIVPCRRIVRNVGFIDLSFIIAFFMLQTLRILIEQSIPPGW